MRVRNVKEEDLDQCFEIERLCFPEDEAASYNNVKKRISGFSEGFLVMEEADGSIIGIINSGCTNKNDISDEEFKALIGHEPSGVNMVIFSLSVHPAYQKKGYASVLMNTYIERSKLMCKNQILLLCKKNLIQYYSKFGFKDRGLSVSEHGNAEWHEMSLLL